MKYLAIVIGLLMPAVAVAQPAQWDAEWNRMVAKIDNLTKATQEVKAALDKSNQLLQELRAEIDALKQERRSFTKQNYDDVITYEPVTYYYSQPVQVEYSYSMPASVAPVLPSSRTGPLRRLFGKGRCVGGVCGN